MLFLFQRVRNVPLWIRVLCQAMGSTDYVLSLCHNIMFNGLSFCGVLSFIDIWLVRFPVLNLYVTDATYMVYVVCHYYHFVL